MFTVNNTMHRVRILIIHILIFLFLFILQLYSPLWVFAQVNLCDPYLSEPINHPHGYRIRGDRCEGIYIQQVGSTTLQVASFTEFFEDYDLNFAKDLLVDWKAPGNNEIHLRAQSLKRRLYYRMDTVRAQETNPYRWPTDLLAALTIQKTHLGIIGWTSVTVGGTERRVYVPLQIGHRPQPSSSKNYQLVVLPGRELTEVFVSLGNVGSDGQPGLFLRDGEALGYGYYPADRGITIPIQFPEVSGLYYLEIGGTLRGGGLTAVELWFYHQQD